jgi:hypothetical protein
MNLFELGSKGMGDEAKKAAAWSNTALPNSTIALDCDGRWIRLDEYGKLSDYGWEIDHAHPVGLGGSDHTFNLRARHWRGNRSAGGVLGGLMGLGSKL